MTALDAYRAGYRQGERWRREGAAAQWLRPGYLMQAAREEAGGELAVTWASGCADGYEGQPYRPESAGAARVCMPVGPLFGTGPVESGPEQQTLFGGNR